MGKIRHAALASVLSLALVGAWAPMAQADEATPPSEASVSATEEATATVEPIAPDEGPSTAPPTAEPSVDAVEEKTLAPSTEPSTVPLENTNSPSMARQSSISSDSSTAALRCSASLSGAPEKAFGIGTNLWGSINGCSSGTVTGEALVNGSWIAFGQTTVDSAGRFILNASTATAQPGLHNLRVRIGDSVSNTVQLERLAAPTAFSAGRKFIGIGTNTWGTIPAAVNQQVWTEVLLPSGQWSRSQTRQTNAAGYFVIPLTYGVNTVGTYRYRVASTYPDGSTVRTPAFTLTRVAPPTPTIATAGHKTIGLDTNAWGNVPGAAHVSIWTEVYRSGEWARSQTGTTDARGNYVLPLTYGKYTVGTYRYRVAALVEGQVYRSKEVALRRTPAVDPRCLTGRALCASKTTNKMHWMIDGRIIETVDVRFGTAKYPTREGLFQINWKSRNHVSSLYGSAMPFSMFFSGGQAIHYSADFARRGQVGGSHGCINVRDWNTLERIYDQARVGDKVVVYW